MKLMSSSRRGIASALFAVAALVTLAGCQSGGGPAWDETSARSVQRDQYGNVIGTTETRTGKSTADHIHDGMETVEGGMGIADKIIRWAR